MKIETSVVRKIGWLIVGLLILFLAWCSTGATNPPEPQSPAPTVIQQDCLGPYRGLHGEAAGMPADLKAHSQLSNRIVPVESYRAGGQASARATFWLDAPTPHRPWPGLLRPATRTTTKAASRGGFHSFFNLDHRRVLVQRTQGLGYSCVPLPVGVG